MSNLNLEITYYNLEDQQIEIEIECYLESINATSSTVSEIFRFQKEKLEVSDVLKCIPYFLDIFEVNLEQIEINESYIECEIMKAEMEFRADEIKHQKAIEFSQQELKYFNYNEQPNFDLL